MGTGLRALAVVLCLVLPAAHGDVVIADDWDARGKMAVHTDAWAAHFDEDAPCFAFEAGGQHLVLAPRFGEEPMVDVPCHTAAIREEGGVRIDWHFPSQSLTLTVHVTEYGGVRIEAPEEIAWRIEAPLAVGVLPGIRIEDVFYRAADYPEGAALPAENWFSGLVAGEGAMFACAWAGSPVDCRLLPGDAEAFAAFEVAPRGTDLYLELMAAPGIWHREILKPEYLEKEITLDWQRPFAAAYRTQALLRGGTRARRAFDFVERPRSQWRPEVGDFQWPVRFNGDRAILNYSKKVVPKGDMIAYPAHNGDRTLRGFLERTPLSAAVGERNEIRSIPKGPRGVPNVGYNACWGTYLLRRTLYVQGRQHREGLLLKEHADFLAERVAMVQRRNRLYFDFIDDIRGRLNTWRAETEDTALRAYLDAMTVHLEAVEEGHQGKLDRYGNHTPEEHIAHAERNAERIKVLLDSPGQECYPEFENMIDQMNRLSWGNDEDTGMRFNMLSSEWALEAAQACADLPQAVHYAIELRAAIRAMRCRAASW